MKTLFLFLMIFNFSFSFATVNSCDVNQVDLLMIGDSQTGAFWASGYFGNYIQKCLMQNEQVGKFVIYGRGGTIPSDWIDRSALDKIETVKRDNEHNHQSLGTNVLECQKRLPSMLETHIPKKVLMFFGDNLLTNSKAEIIKEFKKMLLVLKENNIAKTDCYFLTPTYELEVSSRRNVLSKNLVNTKFVTDAIKEAVGDECQILDGLEIMKKSSLLLSNNLLKRVQRSDGAGCVGASANDNIHICGEAAFDFANRVCALLSK